MRISYERVSFSYGSTEVLRNISFAVESGRTALVVGHNGSGKSTLMRLMIGLLKPSTGRILLGETDTVSKRTSELARLCALSFQNPDDQLFAPTVEKELRFGIDNVKNDGRLLDPVISSLSLGPHKESNPYSLTYALRRMVAIAGSAAMDTPILALDEPTAGLSVREKRYLADLIRLLKERGKTIIVVTHDLDFFLPYTDDIVMLSHGEMVFGGERDVLFGKEDARDLMSRCGISLPAYPRLSAAIGFDKAFFSCADILRSLRK